MINELLILLTLFQQELIGLLLWISTALLLT
jgi:hypothetical protein